MTIFKDFTFSHLVGGLIQTSMYFPMSKGVQVDAFQSCQTLCESMDCRLPGSSGDSPWSFSGKSTGVGCHFLLQGNLPDPGIEPRSPTLQADALPSEPQGSPPKVYSICQIRVPYASK